MAIPNLDKVTKQNEPLKTYSIYNKAYVIKDASLKSRSYTK